MPDTFPYHVIPTNYHHWPYYIVIEHEATIGPNYIVIKRGEEDDLIDNIHRGKYTSLDKAINKCLFLMGLPKEHGHG